MTARIRHQRHRDWDGLRRDRLDHTQDEIASSGIDPHFDGVTETATFQNADNEVTVANQDALPNGTQVVFFADGGALPAELAEGVDYFLREAGVNQYTIFASRADAVADNNAIAITDDGSGTITAYILN